MPNGETHYRIWKTAAPVAVFYSAAFGLATASWEFGLITFAGYLLGRYISPDLDLIGINNDESRMMEELGPVGVVGVMLFFPYAYMMRFLGIGRRGHRNFFSHFPYISTTIRILWLLLIPGLLLWKFYPIIFLWAPTIVGGLVAGLGFADFLHWLADITERKD